MKPEVGEKYRRYDNKLLHVRGFIDDCVIVRWWRKSKQRWEYEIIELDFFDWMVKQESLVNEK